MAKLSTPSAAGTRRRGRLPRGRRLRGTTRDRQLELGFRTWGGARLGSGRPPNGERAGVSHLARPPLSRHHPVHVTLRVGNGLPSLRGTAMFRRIRGALAAARQRFGFRLVHFSVQGNHLHLLAEAQDRRALSRGLQGLTIRVARAINRHLGRRGTVFGDRYHARALKTPRETRNALRYVLGNARKHDRSGTGLPAGHVDPCSSAPWFDGWTRPRDLAFVAGRWARTAESPVTAATSWLLRVGWRRAGRLDADDSPS